MKSLLAYGLSIISGILMMLSMPGHDYSILAWFGLVPLLLALRNQSSKQSYWLINLCAMAWSIGTHLWYPSIFGWSGYLIMIAGGLFYGAILKIGHDMSLRIPRWYGVFALPVAFSVLEWVKTIIPFTKTWWIELIAKSQWTVPANLQLLSYTGFIGLSFIIVLTNVCIAKLIAEFRSSRKAIGLPLALLLIPAANAIFGSLTLSHGQARLADDPIRIGATVDLINQDPDVIALGGQSTAGDGYLADTPQMQQRIFEINRELSRQLTEEGGPLDLIVWGENEFMNLDDAAMMSQLAALSGELGAYIAADTVWETGHAMYDTALLMSPKGEEVGRTPKIFTLWGEESHGFHSGPRDYKIYDTDIGKVALAVCWDRHDPSILRGYARNGAQLALIPADDDFNGNTQFPYFAASDAVFRAVENHMAIGSGSTSGVAQVITPYGEMTAKSGVNERQAIAGETFVLHKPTFYTKHGDAFAYLLSACFLVLLVISERNKARSKSL
ncbi:MAG: hypothetical protein J7559_08180 [Cohnella sp.]|nr:hypothetical protein [Cohnella sp.]